MQDGDHKDNHDSHDHEDHDESSTNANRNSSSNWKAVTALVAIAAAATITTATTIARPSRPGGVCQPWIRWFGRLVQQGPRDADEARDTLLQKENKSSREKTIENGLPLFSGLQVCFFNEFV